MAYDTAMAYLPFPLAKRGFWEELGFTRNFSINFLSTAKLGEWVRMETEVSLPSQDIFAYYSSMTDVVHDRSNWKDHVFAAGRDEEGKRWSYH